MFGELTHMTQVLVFGAVTWIASIVLVLAVLRRAAEAPWWEATLEDINALTVAGDVQRGGAFVGRPHSDRHLK
jgi:hypothetical protein